MIAQRRADVQPQLQQRQTATEELGREEKRLAWQDELERRRLRDERIRQYRAKASRYGTSLPPAEEDAIVASPRKSLAKGFDLGVFEPDMPLRDALDEIQNAGLPLVIMWSDLEQNGYVNENTPIGLEGNGVVNLKLALELVLRSVNQGASPIGYLVDGEVVTVATRAMQMRRKYLKVYDVAEFSSSPWWFPETGGQNGRGQSGYGNSGQGGYGSQGNYGAQGVINALGSGQGGTR